jgi:tryptophan-rich sensory protein
MEYGIEDNYRNRPNLNVKNTINWKYLFEPSQWYITGEKLEKNYLSLIVSFSVCLFAFAIYLYTKNRGTKSKKWEKIKQSNIILSDSTITKLWALSYIPLVISSWLIWVHFEGNWTRDMTVYSSHLAVNALFGISLYMIQDISLALLNLFVLIGVAMFTTAQFGNTLYFASFINTPYLIFLSVYALQFCHFWYLNEGDELLSMTQGKKADEKKKVVGIPSDLKKKLKKKNLEESEEKSKEKNE